MFDFLNRRALRDLRTRNEFLAQQNDHLRTSNAKECAALTRDHATHVESLNNTIDSLRLLATQQRDRVTSHGMTSAERDFLDLCRRIKGSGHVISSRKFNGAMDAIIKQRAQLQDWNENSTNLATAKGAIKCA